MSEILIEREIIGYGPGATHTTILANLPVKPGSLKVWGNIGTENLSGADNGANQITGDHIVSGTVDYSTGVITVEFDQSIPASNEVFVSYTYFKAGVSTLNRVRYVNQDFDSLTSDVTQFIRKYFAADYNDYISSSMGMALVDIVSYAKQNLFWYLNRKVTDFYFPTAKSPTNISILGRTLGYKAQGASPAIVPITVTLSDGPYSFPVTIQAPFAFEGPNGLQFEYRGTVDIVYAPGEVTKTFDVREGETRTDSFISDGTNNQVFKILGLDSDEYIEDGSVKVLVNGEEWTEYDLLPFEAVEAFETNLIASPPTVKFGDGVQGIVPSENFGISVEYVVCHGFRGRIASGTIEAPVVPLTANLENIDLLISQPTSSAGGDDPEDSRSITVNAPLFQKTQDRAITKGDYDWLSNNYPNVAKADAQIVRSVDSDVTLTGVFSEIESQVSNLRVADRYLTPRPQITTITFTKDIIPEDTVFLEVDGTPYTQTFDTDSQTTLEALATQIEAHAKIESAVLRATEYGNVLVLTGVADETFTITNEQVTGGTVAGVTVLQLSPPPAQEQRITLDADLFEGNVFSLEYDGNLLEIPYETSTEDAITAMGAAIEGFAEVPEASVNETQSAPRQIHEIEFNKDFYKGNLIKFYVKDLSLEEPVDTLVQVGFTTDNASTYALVAAKLAALSFIQLVTPDAGNKKLTVHTYSQIPQEISDEVIAYGDASNTVFTGTALNTPIKAGTFKIQVGAVVGVDDGLEVITGTGISGTVSYSSGAISITFAAAPAAGAAIYINYNYFSSSRTIEFSSIEVTNNTVTVDTINRQIDVVTDGPNNLPITNAIVTQEASASVSDALTQSMIEEDLGSVASIATVIESQCSVMKEYLDVNMSDGCRANTVQVSVLSKDQARKYIAPPDSLLEELKAYLEERKDAVHTVNTVSGFDKVIEVDLRVEVEVGANAVEDDVVNKIDDVIKKSDTQPYGILVERDFNKSLYQSEVYNAITAVLEEREYNYLNVIIEGPSLHSTQLISDEHITVGTAAPSQTISYTSDYQPMVESYVAIKVDGVTVAEDDGSGNISEVLGSAYTVTGTVVYSTGQLDFVLTPAPALNENVTVSYYKSLLDRRGNLICPDGHVLQYGTLNIDIIPREL
jgi:hypothetical protein